MTFCFIKIFKTLVGQSFKSHRRKDGGMETWRDLKMAQFQSFQMLYILIYVSVSFLWFWSKRFVARLSFQMLYILIYVSLSFLWFWSKRFVARLSFRNVIHKHEIYTIVFLRCYMSHYYLSFQNFVSLVASYFTMWLPSKGD